MAKSINNLAEANCIDEEDKQLNRLLLKSQVAKSASTTEKELTDALIKCSDQLSKFMHMRNDATGDELTNFTSEILFYTQRRDKLWAKLNKLDD